MDHIYIPKIVFSNKKLSRRKINVLEREFIERYKIAVNISSPMYEKWDKEFEELRLSKDGCGEDYLNFLRSKQKDGCGDDYLNFIRSKEKDAIDIANAKAIGKNRVRLYLDKYCSILGVCSEWNTTIELCLIKK